MKTYLGSPLLLSRPVQGEKLYLYLAVSEFSAAIVRDKDEVKKPLYFNIKDL